VDLIDLPLECPACHRPLTVTLRSEAAPGRTEWPCPYEDCGVVNWSNLGGTVQRVSRGWSNDRSKPGTTSV
jgi:hypothetical protein